MNLFQEVNRFTRRGMPDLDKLFIGLCENDTVMEAHKLAHFALDRDFDVSFSTYDRVLERPCTLRKRHC
jgi:hypothetical protein